MVISYEYIRGLIEGEGSFTFSTNRSLKMKVPAFAISMHVRDEELLKMVKDRLNLHNKIYTYYYPAKGLNRGPQSTLIVREFGELKNTIIPLCYQKLKGNKGRQFQSWIDKIGADPWISARFKFLYKLHTSGFYLKDNQIKRFM
jgi:hypothetical protein